MALALDPGRADVEEAHDAARFWGLMTRASAALDQDQIDAAMTAFEQALALDPAAADALLGLAGAAERARDDAVAAKAYAALTAADPGDVRGWLGLIRVQTGAGDPAAVLRTAHRIPAAVQRQLEERSDHLARLSLALFGTGQRSAGEDMLRRALYAAARDDSAEALSVRLQTAALLMEQSDVELAIAIYTHATETHPDNVTAWQGLVGAYVGHRDFARAMTTVRAMPRGAYEAAMEGAGFLNALAATHAAHGRCDQAAQLLTRSLELDAAAGRTPPAATRLQLADIRMRQGRYAEASRVYRDILAADETSANAWRGYIAALDGQRDHQRVVAEVRRIPAAVRAQLWTDVGFLRQLAGAFSRAVQHDRAVTLLGMARARYRSEGRVPPADLDLQLGWAMLSSSRSDGVGDLVTGARARGDLTQDDRDEFDELWAAWILSRADAALKADDAGRALAILDDTRHERLDHGLDSPAPGQLPAGARGLSRLGHGGGRSG